MILPLAIVCIALGLLNIINQITMGFMRKTIDLQRRTIATQHEHIGNLQVKGAGLAAANRGWTEYYMREHANDAAPTYIDGEARTIN